MENKLGKKKKKSKQSVKSCSHATKLSEFDGPVHMTPFRLRHYPNFLEHFRLPSVSYNIARVYKCDI